MASYGASVGGDSFLRRALAGEGLGGEFAAAIVGFRRAGLGQTGQILGLVLGDDDDGQAHFLSSANFGKSGPTGI